MIMLRSKLSVRYHLLRYSLFKLPTNRITGIVPDDINYERKTPHEHVLLRPGMYVGETDPVVKETWLYNATEKVMERKSIKVSSALIKIFDETLVNAADNRYKDPGMTVIDVNIGVSDGQCTVSIRNDGLGIPVVRHKDEPDLYVPGLVFGHLLTGSNFDDGKAQLTGGRHGYGAKLANIFSRRFTVDTVDSRRGLQYKQTWENNMNTCHAPVITHVDSSVSDYTEVSFSPDLDKFHTVLSKNVSADSASIDDAIHLMQRRAFDMAACLKGITVKVNGEPLQITDFSDYVELFRSVVRVDRKSGDYVNNSDEESRLTQVGVDSEGTATGEASGIRQQKSAVKAVSSLPPVMYCDVNDRWSVAVGMSASGAFEQMSFVNGVWTSAGGSHVDLVTNQVVAAVMKELSGQRPPVEVLPSPRAVKSRLCVFVRSDIESAAFNSQTKDELTSPATKFGSQCQLPESYLAAIMKESGVVEELVTYLRAKELRYLDRSKKARLKPLEIPKLEDAHLAATKRAMECTLILTEGDSAKALAVAGLEEVGRDLYGVMPLRGKLLNVHGKMEKSRRVGANTELNNITKALGLKYGRTYTMSDDPSEWHRQGLRYGRVLLMADQDHDGSHIKGLVMNFLHRFWPNLLSSEGFVQQFITPLVKAKSSVKAAKDDNGEKGQQKWFYSLQEYEAWRRLKVDEQDATKTSDDDEMTKNKNTNDSSIADPRSYSVKYYKGLGTNNAAEGREYFRSLDTHVKDFYSGGDHSSAINLAFCKSRASDRRKWLQSSFDSKAFLDPIPRRVSVEDFIHKELIHFSQASNVRSIPNVIDGLKPSQRKVLYSCFKRKLDKEIKVVQLAGYVAEQTAYHHGEASLHSTIIHMAQDFVGANNVPLLLANGQFGTRARGGKDYASARYIFTQLSPMARLLFPEADDVVLKRMEEDGQLVEPYFYVPVVPTLLVNGSQGVGSGWSTDVPGHNLFEIIDHVESRVRGTVSSTKSSNILPWTRGFTGDINWADESIDTSVAKSIGKIEITDDKTITISELPVGVWTENYKCRLVDMLRKKLITKFKEYHTNESVRFVVTISKQFWDDKKGIVLEEGEGQQQQSSSMMKSMTRRKQKNQKRTESESALKVDMLQEGEVSEEALPQTKLEKLIQTFHLQRFISLRNMNAFDARGHITRYPTASSILDAHFPVRLATYEARRLALLQELIWQEAYARNRSQFIDSVISGTVPLQRPGEGAIPSQEMENMLRALGFDSVDMLGGAAGSSVGGDEASSESSAATTATGQSRAFSYLLDLPLHSLSLERVQQLRQRAESARSALEELRRRTAADLWLRDLHHLRDGAKEHFAAHGQ